MRYDTHWSPSVSVCIYPKEKVAHYLSTSVITGQKYFTTIDSYIDCWKERERNKGCGTEGKNFKPTTHKTKFKHCARGENILELFVYGLALWLIFCLSMALYETL